MAISPGLRLSQTHSLVMTPQLRLAIRIMQMSSVEVTQLVAEELERNPLLIQDDREGPETAAPERPAPDQIAGDAGHALSALTPLKSGTLAGPGDHPLDTDYAAEACGGGFDDGSGVDGAPVPWRHGAASWEGQDDLAAAVQPSLQDRLSAQLRLTAGLTPRQRLIGANLIACLGPAGRLENSPAEIAAALGVPPDDVEHVRALMMTGFEPVGLFARSLKECLTAQLVVQNRFDPAMEVLLGHLDLIAGRHYTKLRGLCGVDEADFAEMLAELRRLDPRPGFEAEADPAVTIIPDVLIRRAAEGEWLVELNEEALPRLRVDDRLQMRVVLHGGKEDRGFVQARIADANGLIRALAQRGRTLLQVASEIMRRQSDFLKEGVTGLHPLTLKDIAGATGLHESTVSRVTSGKYIATPRGVLELKYFFTNAVRRIDGGENHSAAAIRFKIRSMVDTETHGAILSDDEIMQRLRKEGIDIARRTVAKYRDALHIASSVQRKREKAAPA
ncbi:RNA polymerase factor sigma-54 [Acetobacter musti]|uniref:RNA polymerase sigma-54 factor n=1 Tax=Acetobacter musti TaxID=864732 RepID=A0ABX0JIL7_9PROT|nr:RNA polymerase factor sigma-54 [Acetobacter musti]NHN83070.1 RNA polymerase factor sigma-54 [Acetobacter musti]